MPVPALLFGAITIMAFVFAPPSIIITAPVWVLVFAARHQRKVEAREVRYAQAVERDLQERMAAARAIIRMGK